VVTGATGMLGSVIVKQLEDDFEIIATSTGKRGEIGKNFVKIDMENATRKDFESFLGKIKPDVIIHCAAMTNVKLGQTNPEYFRKINVDAVEHLIKVAKGIKIIYISTDAVYGNEHAPHPESQIKKPATYYALTKSMAEDLVMEECNNYAILRVTPVGVSEYNKNHGLSSWILNSIKNGTSINGYENAHFSPFSIWQLAEELRFIINKDLKGTFNLGSKDHCSKYDFAELIISKFFPDQLSLLSKSKHELRGRVKTIDQRLSTDLYEKETGRTMPLVSDVIDDIFENAKEFYL
jgi:dTDP-4-dehydrorhamnose reductase